MNEQKLRISMMIFIFIGIALILTGIYFIAFTNIAITEGTAGIFKIAGLITGGLLLSAPPKIYLILQSMKYNDDKVITANKYANDKHTDEN